jgi:hypothetical protein
MCRLPSHNIHSNYKLKQKLLLTSQVRLALLVRPLKLATATITAIALDQRLAIVQHLLPQELPAYFPTRIV